MAIPKSSLPLPTRCLVCNTTVHAVSTAARKMRRGTIPPFIWVHDVPLLSLLRRGGSHEAIPDPDYPAPLFRALMGRISRDPGRPQQFVGVASNLLT